MRDADQFREELELNVSNANAGEVFWLLGVEDAESVGELAGAQLEAAVHKLAGDRSGSWYAAPLGLIVGWCVAEGISLRWG
jgi:hypothetical protein